jgi:hypothetical protein
MRRLGLVLCVVAILTLASERTPLVAWGAQGHHVVARIAWALMTPAARDEATSLLDGGQDVFIAMSTWADDVRSSRPETYNWHFVDIPVDATHYDAARDCAPTERGDCVIAEIARARDELADRSRSKEKRAEALKFLIHFVGDLHQPLHAVDDHDRGGNDVRVNSLRDSPGGRTTNLHSVWDTGLINLSSETEAARTARLLDALTAARVKVDLDVVRWAEESHDVAAHVTYHYPEFSPQGPPSDPITLSPAYLDEAAKTIDAQLMKAGARLGALLNTAVGGR